MHTTLGQGLQASAIGYGCMGLSQSHQLGVWWVLFRAGMDTGFRQPGALERGERGCAHAPQ